MGDSSRYVLTTSPQALPGSCYLCGSANRESFVDVKTDIQYHGAVYFCNLCVKEIANLYGFIDPYDAEILKQENASLFSLVDSQRQEIYNLEDSLGNLISVLRGRGIDPPSPVVEQEGLPSGETDVAEGTVGTPESVHDEGVAIVPDDAAEPAPILGSF